MYDVTGAIPIRVEVVNNEELLESTPVVKSPEVIKITTEALQTKAFTLKAYPQSKAAEGYEAGEGDNGAISGDGQRINLPDRTDQQRGYPF